MLVHLLGTQAQVHIQAEVVQTWDPLDRVVGDMEAALGMEAGLDKEPGWGMEVVQDKEVAGKHPTSGFLELYMVWNAGGDADTDNNKST